MANDKRTCKACGTEYKYCPTCAKYASLPTWMWKCDTEECNEIFDAVSAYKMGVKSSDCIKEALDKFEIKDYSKFSDSIQKTLNELFPLNKSFKKNKRKPVEDVDVELKEEVSEPIVLEESNIVDNTLEIKGISELL